MKKKIFIIIVLILFIFLFVGCAKKSNENNRMYVIDYSNNIDGANIELNIWNQESFENNNAPRTYRIVYNGNTYDGKYLYSVNRKCDSYIQNIYNTDDCVQFAIKDGTENIVYLNFQTKEFFNTEPYKEEVVNQQEYAIELSKTIASDFINIDDYIMSIGDPKVYSVEEDTNDSFSFYFVTFAREINGLSTSDYITVKTTSKGTLASIILGDVGIFEEIKTINYSISELNQRIDNKVKSFYKKLDYEVINNSIDRQIICMTQSGEICIYSSQKVIVHSNNVNEDINTGVVVLVYLEDEGQ